MVLRRSAGKIIIILCYRYVKRYENSPKTRIYYVIKTVRVKFPVSRTTQWRVTMTVGEKNLKKLRVTTITIQSLSVMTAGQWYDIVIVFRRRL